MSVDPILSEEAWGARLQRVLSPLGLEAEPQPTAPFLEMSKEQENTKVTSRQGSDIMQVRLFASLLSRQLTQSGKLAPRVRRPSAALCPWAPAGLSLWLLHDLRLDGHRPVLDATKASSSGDGNRAPLRRRW